jgi:hypothetical protein
MKPLSATDKQVLVNLDWGIIIPLAIEAFKAYMAGDWQKVIQLVIAIIKVVAEVEEKMGVKIDWSTLLPLILQIIKMIMDMMGNDDPSKPPIELGVPYGRPGNYTS